MTQKQKSAKILARSEEAFLVGCLADIISLEQEVESLKIALSLRSDFNLIDAFSLLDPSCRSEVTASELQEQLHSLGVELSDHELRLLFARYAENPDLLTYSKFSDIFLPCDEFYCRQLIGKRLTFKDTTQGKKEGCEVHSAQWLADLSCFDSETLDLFASVWHALVKLERATESIRRKLVGRPAFDLEQAFKSLDSDSDGFITVKDVSALRSDSVQIADMMAEYGLQSVAAADIELLVRRLLKGSPEGRVDLRNFRQSMTPVLPI